MTSPAEEMMDRLLDGSGYPYDDQVKVAGHSIDFVIDAGTHLVLVDPNGDRWHRWGKVKACDRIKLNRVLGADPRRKPEKPCIPLGVWWTRLQHDSVEVLMAIDMAVEDRKMAFWDWAVEPDDLDPVAQTRLKEVW